MKIAILCLVISACFISFISLVGCNSSNEVSEIIDDQQYSEVKVSYDGIEDTHGFDTKDNRAYINSNRQKKIIGFRENENGVVYARDEIDIIDGENDSFFAEETKEDYFDPITVLDLSVEDIKEANYVIHYDSDDEEIFTVAETLTSEDDAVFNSVTIEFNKDFQPTSLEYSYQLEEEESTVVYTYSYLSEKEFDKNFNQVKDDVTELQQKTE